MNFIILSPGGSKVLRHEKGAPPQMSNLTNEMKWEETPHVYCTIRESF